MRLGFRLVDVFAKRPLQGNQLCVVPEGTSMTDARMLAVAKEIGFSETTFVTSAGGDRYSMRIFTPGGELPFAGHPTLGTAFVLVSERRVSSPAIQTVAAGEFAVDVDVPGNHARMRQLPAVFGTPLSARQREDVATALGIDASRLRGDVPCQVVSTGIGHLIVALTDEDAVRAVEPRPRSLAAVLRSNGTDGCYVFASSGQTAKARYFAPEVGVSEDPATGSAAGPLGAFCREHDLIQEADLTIHQGDEMGRPSVLRVEVQRDGDAWRPWVGGGVFVVGSGEFVLDDQEEPPARSSSPSR